MSDNEININSGLNKKKLVVLGAAESGIGAALLGMLNGFEVFVSDSGEIKNKYKSELSDSNIEFEEKGHDINRILNADIIVKSPGIPEKNELIKKIRNNNIEVISEIEFAYRFKGESKIVAITGSNGKSTTTTLVYHICETAGLDCALVGNIGYSFAKQIAENKKPLYIAEISSFQLDDIKYFKPDVSILLNITEDHLDRYDYKFENYINSKFQIIKNADSNNYFIYNEDDEVITNKLNSINPNTNLIPISMKRELPTGAYIKNGYMTIKVKDERIDMSIHDFALKGKHNQYNTMAAGIAAATLGIRKEKIREAVTSFNGLEHRMEKVATVRGIDFINDSKATNVNSTWYALESMEKPTVLILGGTDKGNDYSLISELVKEKVKAIVCMGVDNEKIHKAFPGVTMTDTSSAAEAVNAAFRFSVKGDVVLLSPACASFDLFINYEDRGRQFKEAVKNL